MNDIQNTDNDNSDAYHQLLSIFNSTSIGLLYQLSPFVLSEEQQAVLDEMLGQAKVELIAYLDGLELERALNQKIDAWRNEAKDPKHTRVIVKLINNTSRPFKIAQTSLPLSQSERESFRLSPQEPTAFKSKFDYNFNYNSKSRVMFNHFIDFAVENIGVRFDLGMIMKKSFGVLQPTLTPIVKNTVTSIGNSSIKCSTKTTNMSDDAPYNFEVEITLG